MLCGGGLVLLISDVGFVLLVFYVDCWVLLCGFLINLLNFKVLLFCLVLLL